MTDNLTPERTVILPSTPEQVIQEILPLYEDALISYNTYKAIRDALAYAEAHKAITGGFAFKTCCDHCGAIVKRDYWTFNLNQCVVCDDDNCKKKQRAILNKAIDDGVNIMFEKLKKSG